MTFFQLAYYDNRLTIARHIMDTTTNHFHFFPGSRELRNTDGVPTPPDGVPTV
jgi:hypothetical protein